MESERKKVQSAARISGKEQPDEVGGESESESKCRRREMRVGMEKEKNHCEHRALRRRMIEATSDKREIN